MKLKKLIATSLTMAMAFTLAPIAVPNQSKAKNRNNYIVRFNIDFSIGSATGKTVRKKKIKESKLTLPILPVPAQEFQMQ